MEVISKHPEIIVNDLHTFVMRGKAFPGWRTRSHGVHFGKVGSRALGHRVGKVILKALSKN